MLQLSDVLLKDLQLVATRYQQFAAAAAAGRPGDALVRQLLQSSAVQESAAAREHLVAAAAAAIWHRGGSWQVTDALQLSTALQGAAPLQQRVQAAIAEGLFTKRALLAAQTDASMSQLSHILLSNAQLRAAYYDHFAAAVAQRPKNYELLKQLLQSESLRAHLAMPEVQQLVECQVANLQRLGAVPPFTWNMPQASIPSYPQVCGCGSNWAVTAMLRD